LFSLCALACIVLVGSGCSDGRPSRVKVSGQVTLEGEPVTTGSVTFKPASGGRIGAGNIQSDGGYLISMYEEGDGLPPGKYLVAISSSKDVNDTTRRWLAPKEYSKATTSGLTAEISEDTDSMNFELTWEGSKHEKPWNEKL